MSGWYYMQKHWTGEHGAGPISDLMLLEFAYSGKLSAKSAVMHPKHTNGTWIFLEQVPLAKKQLERAVAEQQEAEQTRLKETEEVLERLKEAPLPSTFRIMPSVEPAKHRSPNRGIQILMTFAVALFFLVYIAINRTGNKSQEQQPQRSPAVAEQGTRGTGIDKQVLLRAMNRIGRAPNFDYTFHPVDGENEDDRVYIDIASKVALKAYGPDDDLKMVYLAMTVENYNEDVARGGNSFGECAERLAAVIDPSWSREFSNWINESITTEQSSTELGSIKTHRDLVVSFKIEHGPTGEPVLRIVIVRNPVK